MPILVTCRCGQQFETRDENAGRRAKCPECGNELVVPGKPTLLFPGDEFAAPRAPLGDAVTSGKAIASLLLGLSSLLCAFFTGVPAIILGVLGLGDIKRSGGRVKGSGLATTGIALGAIGSSLTVLGVLVGLLLPAVQAAREAGRRAQCQNNMKNIGLAMVQYANAKNAFPPAAITDPNGRRLLSWRVAILPYLESQTLYSQFHLDEPWDSPHNLALAKQMPMQYRCPSDPKGAAPGGTTTVYQVVVGPHTLFPGDNKPVTFLDVTDGMSNTLMVVEARKAVPWTAPEDVTFDPTAPNSGFGSNHPGGYNVVFADGSVRFLFGASINPKVVESLTTRDGGEVISPDSL